MKGKLKGIGSIFMAVCMIITMMPANGWAVPVVSEFEDDNFRYEVLDDGDGGEKRVSLMGFIEGESASTLTVAGAVYHNGISYMVTEIGDYAFYRNHNIEKVEISDSVETIGYNAFGYTNITSISIPKSVTSIGGFACYGYYFEELIVDDENPNYSSEEGVLYNEDKTKLIQYPSGKTSEEFTIPGGVTILGEGSFYGNIRLEKLTIASTVNKIEEGTFAFTNLKVIVFLGDGNSLEVESGEDVNNIFDYANNLSKIYVPKGSLSNYETKLRPALNNADIDPDIIESITVTNSSELIDALKDSVPKAILVSQDMTLTGEITLGANHTLIIDAGKTVSTGNAHLIIPADKILYLEGRLKISAGSTLEIKDGTGRYNINGGYGGTIILEEGASVKGANGIFEDRGYWFRNNEKFTVTADDDIPSYSKLTAGEYNWGENEYEEDYFIKEGDIDWDKGYGLVVGGVRVDEKNADDIKGGMIGYNDNSKISYNKPTNTLTLKNAKIFSEYELGYYEYGIYSRDDINIKLEENSVIGDFGEATGYNISYGIYASGKDITISGDGNLTIYDSLMGILGKNITLSSTGNITIKEHGGPDACCIKADSGTLTINSGNLNLNSKNSNALYGDNIYINGGTIIAKSENSQAFNKSPAFSANSEYTIKAGTNSSDAAVTTPDYTEKYIEIMSKPFAGDNDDNNGSGNGGNGGGNDSTSSPQTPKETSPVPKESDSEDKEEAKTEVKWDNPFLDIKEESWSYEAIKYVYENGLMRGTADENFSPNESTSRGMIVTILHRLAGLPSSEAISFDDIAEGKYYSDAVSWALANKIVNGYGNNIFGPEDSITREQLAVILMNFAKFKGYDITARADLSMFEDADNISDWAREAMAWANALGLIQGDGLNLMPIGNATREQTAAIIYRFIEMFEK